MNTPAKEAWIERAVALLDESTEALDAATLSHLNRSRQAALAQRRGSRSGWLVGGGLAAAALALAFGINHRSASLVPPVPVTTGPDAADTELLATDDNLDLYENLDFYAWLDAEQQDDNG
jgi:hypothetical protein